MPKSRIMAFTWATVKNLFSKPVTSKYPAEPIAYPEGSRGHIEIDIDDCISCGICEKSCPPRAITVKKPPEGTWGIERMDCIACGYCVSVCPKKCLHMVEGYQTPGGEKIVDTFQRPHMGEEYIKAQEEKKKAALAAAAAKKAAAGNAAAPAAGTAGTSPAAGAAPAAKPAAAASTQKEQT